MKAKRFILMLLVMLGSVAGAWAQEEVDYTCGDHSALSSGSIDDIKGRRGASFKDAPRFVIIDTRQSCFLDSCILTSILHSQSISVSVEGSNDQSSWTMLHSGSTFQGNTSLRIDCETQYRYYRFTFTNNESVVIIAELQIYGYILYGEGVAENPYLINNSKELQMFYEKCATNPAACGKLTQDIDMTNTAWNPEGVFSYTGTLDGNNHVISNLTSSVGLFRTTGAATIKNLTLKNATLSATEENGGGLAAQANGTNFQNCKVTGTISANGTNTGGLVGDAVNCTFANCQVNGLNITGANVGGLVGNANGTSFTTCLVLSDITAVGCTTVGGLAGKTTNNATFTKCYSIGNYSVGSANAGALVGNTEGSTTFNQCYAAANMNNDGGVHLPVCSGGNATFNNSYYYGTGSETAVSKADVGNGRLTYLLNNGNLTGPYFQRIGTDAHPSLTMTENSYVYLALDNVNYTNMCPHREHTITPFKAPSCLGADGNAEYGKCKNSLCGMYFPTSDRNVVTTNTKNFILSKKAVNIQDHSFYGGFWTYSTSKTKNGTTYYKVMEVTVNRHAYHVGDYELSYTSMDDDPTMKVHLFFDSNVNYGSFSIRFYVNGIERPALYKGYPCNISEQHEIVTVDGLHKFDRVIVVLNYLYEGPNSSEEAHLFVGTEKPEEIRSHNLHKHELSYNCIDGGHKEYYQCDYCESLLTQNTPLNDDNVTTWNNLVLAPVGAHNFGSANPDTQKEDNLYGVQCQNEHCTAFDPDHYVLRNYHNDTDLPLTYDGSTYSTSSPVSLTDGKAYVTPVAFDAPSLTYSRYYPENVWSAWFAPFDVNASYLKDNGLTPAYIEGIHNYDDNEDGTIDRTVMEIVKISNGRLRAGTPLLVRAAEGYSSQLVLSDVTMMANGDIQPMQSSTMTSTFNFLGTFTGTTAVADDNIYSLSTSTGALVHRTGNILPLRWYCQIEQKPSFIGEETTAPALARAIYIRVIGEENQTTGIRTLYDEADQTEERADGIFDLSGRKLTVPQHGQINIINGKKQFVK